MSGQNITFFENQITAVNSNFYEKKIALIRRNVFHSKTSNLIESEGQFL